MTVPDAARPGADRCPGLLRPHRAADGAMVRLRVPGGRLPVPVLASLLQLAGRHGAPVLQLTSRGNLQLRGLPDPLPDELVTGVAGCGLLPAPEHERARNVLAPPFDADLQELVAELDAGLVADPALADLPGRFLLVADDETGRLLGEPYDLAWQRTDPRKGRLLAAGRGRPVPRRTAAAELLGLAREFLAARPSVRTWTVADLPPGSPFPDRLAAPAREDGGAPAPPAPGEQWGGGWLVGVPLGLLRRPHLDALAAVTDVVGLTPWRSLLLAPRRAGDPPDLSALAAAGLVLDPASPWARLTACVGAPHCGRTTVPTMALATEAATRMAAGGPQVHVVGCDRACGRPRGEHALVLEPRDAGDVVAAAGEGPGRD